jgi:enoyl-CoA hydratase/carnithine racemase
MALLYQNIIYKTEGRIAYIEFNRPEVHNALNEEMILELDDVLGTIQEKPELGALILTGVGKSFLSGADIRMISKGLEAPYEFYLLHDKLTRFNFGLERLRIPAIAAINGFALGGGLEIAAACDFRIASENAKLGMPEVKLGIMGGAGGTARLIRLIGKEYALEMELTGDPINAQEAYRIGLISKVVPEGQVVMAAEDLAKRILANAPAAIAQIKRVNQICGDMSLEAAMEYSQCAAMMLSGTIDSKEGINAFVAKREPRWRGK